MRLLDVLEDDVDLIGLVLAIFTTASVMARVRSRFWSMVRPAYHWIVMFGMTSSSGAG